MPAKAVGGDRLGPPVKIHVSSKGGAALGRTVGLPWGGGGVVTKKSKSRDPPEYCCQSTLCAPVVLGLVITATNPSTSGDQYECTGRYDHEHQIYVDRHASPATARRRRTYPVHICTPHEYNLDRQSPGSRPSTNDPAERHASRAEPLRSGHWAAAAASQRKK